MNLGVSATTDDLLGDKFQIPQLLVHRPLLAQSKNAHSRSVDQLDGVETNKETSEEVNAQEQQQHNTLETEELEHTLQNKSDIQVVLMLMICLKEHFTGLRISDSTLGAKRFWSHIKLGSLALSQSKLDSRALC